MQEWAVYIVIVSEEDNQACRNRGFLPGCFVPSESASTGTVDYKRALVAEGTVADDCKYLDRCMEEVTRFLIYSYSEQHLNLDDAETFSHSSRFAVNAKAHDGHLSNQYVLIRP
jgi:hypothetical protein